MFTNQTSSIKELPLLHVMSTYLPTYPSCDGPCPAKSGNDPILGGRLATIPSPAGGIGGRANPRPSLPLPRPPLPLPSIIIIPPPPPLPGPIPAAAKPSC